MSNTARVGLFMLLALIVLGVFIVKIEEIPIGAKGGRVLVKAIFPSVAGLDEKSPVRVAGVRIGIVQSIALQGDHALVTLALDPGVVLHEGATAEVTSLGMLGDKYVELFPGKLSGPRLSPDTVLTGTSPVAFDEVMKNLNDIGGDVKSITASLRQSLGGTAGQKRLDEIIENIRQLSADLKAAVEANRTNVDATIGNFRQFSETLKTELPKIAEKINKLADNVDSVVAANRENVTESIANIKEISAKLRTSADNLNDREARQRPVDGGQPQRRAQVRRGGYEQPQEHPGKNRTLAPEHQPAQRGAAETLPAQQLPQHHRPRPGDEPRALLPPRVRGLPVPPRLHLDRGDHDRLPRRPQRDHLAGQREDLEQEHGQLPGRLQFPRHHPARWPV
jgi:virulence factor Mce-like protein